jgi:uncharacterized DUF497 family protein
MYILDMRFEWDENKRLYNIEKHGLDFRDADAVFKDSHVVVPSKYKGGEQRFLAIGILEGRFVTVVYTMRGKNFRIISFRRARHEERQKYQELYVGRA